MNLNRAELLRQLDEIFGPEWVKTSDFDLQYFGKDWTQVFQPNPMAIVFPSSIEEVQKLVQMACQNEVPLVPSGGRTGLSGGAVAENREIVIVFDRMNKILDFDITDRQVVCEPGVITKELQLFAEEKGLFYPVDFASSSSSQLGGNVATNAGGIKVIRYGMTRQWIVGMKVVTGTGELIDLNRGLTKNATGYDFRHLFIGSEGTLGIIVEITLSLCSKPRDPTVLLFGAEQMTDTVEVLKAFQNNVTLTAFEFFSDKALNHVIGEKNLRRPFETHPSFYVLVEFENLSEKDLLKAAQLFEHCLKQGWVVDGVISQSSRQSQNLWSLREGISESISKFSPYKNDISVTVSRIPAFLREVETLVNQAYPDFEIIWFGHIGDGNVHLNILKPEELEREDFNQQCRKISQSVYDLVAVHGGSISAEHGIGLMKKPFLHYSRSDAELELMKGVKRVFDPKNIMNPGKLIDI
ncbi:MAG: FAD-binding oxidoreductase [Gammaproteobacteria bacterium]|nr:FAD-binding oxidoreductase [Gammaproteobacteria bacterium]|tara:strand:+ start:994 stop:2394 length:1401 start_codon:yes stop_codon:yes gene_type:complete